MVPYNVVSSLLEHITQPSTFSFSELRAAYLGSGLCSSYDEHFFVIRELIDDREFLAALDALTNVMPQLLLSPRAHWWAAYLNEQLGRSSSAVTEQQVGDLLLEGILSTGDGSPDNPFAVLRVDDEYDVLGALKKTFVRQELRSDPRCDVLICDDESELWFDLADMVQGGKGR